MGETTEARQPVEVYRSRSSYPCKYLFTAEVRVIRPRSKAIIRHRVGVTKYIKTNKIRPKPPTMVAAFRDLFSYWFSFSRTHKSGWENLTVCPAIDGNTTTSTCVDNHNSSNSYIYTAFYATVYYITNGEHHGKSRHLKSEIWPATAVTTCFYRLFYVAI